MPLIFHKEHNTRKPEKRNSDVYKKLVQKKIIKNLSKEWLIGFKFRKKTTDKAILEQKLKSDPYLADLLLMVLLIQDHH